MQERRACEKVAFGPFEVDLVAGELTKHGIRVRLQDQPFRILQTLIESRGEIVTREELQKRIWPSDTFVDFDHGINNAIKRLREALGDSAENARYVETIPRRGYRFIAKLNGANGRATLDPHYPAPNERNSQVRSGKWVRTIGFVVGTGVLIVALLLSATSFKNRTPGKSATRIQSLAVLPLTNLSADPSQDYFVDGMTDALITEMSQIASIKVISRTSALRYRHIDKSLPQIARELNVDGVVEGTVQRSGERLRITAQLIEGKTDNHLWAKTYDRSAEDALSVQGEIAGSIAREIRAQITPDEKARMAQPRPVNMRAVEAFLQGAYHYQKAKDLTARRGTEEQHNAELAEAINFFQQAVTEDPNYARAYVGMGEIWGAPAVFPYPPISMAQPARQALRKALAIDPGFAEAYVALGQMDYRNWNWPALEQESKRAIELDPNSAPAHELYSAYLLAMGRFDEAMQEAERTQELDPGSDRIAWVFYCERKFDRFIEFKKTDVARNAHGAMAHYDLGFGYERVHMESEALKEWEEAMTGFGFDDLAGALRRGYAAGGFKAAMAAWARGYERLSKQGEAVLPDLVAYIYSIQGDRDRAFAWLEKSMQMHSSAPPAFKIDPTYDELRPDPRYAELIRRVGLTP
jgi:TolB-like protein/DNA-binding winged helix-turn-helix (wHTH) protein